MVVRKPASVLSIFCEVCHRRKNDGDHAVCASLKKQKGIERPRYEHCLASLDERERIGLMNAFDATCSFEDMFDLLGSTQRIVDSKSYDEQSRLTGIIMGFQIRLDRSRQAADI